MGAPFCNREASVRAREGIKTPDDMVMFSYRQRAHRASINNSGTLQATLAVPVLIAGGGEQRLRASSKSLKRSSVLFRLRLIRPGCQFVDSVFVRLENRVECVQGCPRPLVDLVEFAFEFTQGASESPIPLPSNKRYSLAPGHGLKPSLPPASAIRLPFASAIA
jgi:hypothetical protein